MTKLEDVSPAYFAYKALGRLPKNAPVFEFRKGEFPKVHYGERYCRAPGRKDGLCGKVLTRPNTLLDHLVKVHEVPKKYRPHWVSALSNAERRGLVDFYEDLMKHEEYDRTQKYSDPSAARRDTMRRNKLESTWIAASMEDEADDDEFLGETEGKSEYDRQAVGIEPEDGGVRGGQDASGEDGREDSKILLKEEDEINTSIALPSAETEADSMQDHFDDEKISIKYESHSTDSDAGMDEQTENIHVNDERMNDSTTVDRDEEEEDLELQLAEAEMRQQIQKTELEKIQLRRKLAALRKARR